MGGSTDSRQLVVQEDWFPRQPAAHLKPGRAQSAQRCTGGLPRQLSSTASAPPSVH
jgi:hypothetical protein